MIARRSGVDAFTVHNCRPADSAKKNNTYSEELHDTYNIFQKNDGQGLLPKTVLNDTLHNNGCDFNERRCLPIQNQCRYSCLNYKQCILEQDRNNFSCDLLKTLIKLVDKRLTKKQKLVLKKIVTTKKNTTMTSLSDRLSEELNVSKTTVRVNNLFVILFIFSPRYF